MALLHAWPAWSLEGIRGANFLQSRSVAWGSPQAARSLALLRDAGAAWVAFVPFLAQSGRAACDIALAPHYDMEALRALIRQARALGLKVALKPQFLVQGSWAGEIAAKDESGWKCWFAAYRGVLLPMARLAQEEGVELFVAGTELKGTESRPEWRELLLALGRAYSGPVSYVFHAPEDARRFQALSQLDLVGLSLYPRLGASAAEAFRTTAWQRHQLRKWARSLAKPVWIAEVGIPSRVGAGVAPWQWIEHATEQREPDLAYQAQALAYWLDALSGGWNRGVLVWNWFSDPDAGGPGDADYTPQNKPAQQVLSCFWRGGDMTKCAP
jgi:hypothetical protein